MPALPVHGLPHTPSHKLHPFNVPTAPRQLIGIDLATDLPPVKNLSHVVLLVDYNTKYIHVTPVKSKSSSDLLHAFTQYVKDFGIPHAVRHDQELGLTGGDFAAFCSAHNIEQMTTLPYKGQSNGRTEVQIRNFKHALQKHCLAADAKSTWPDEIWKIQLSLNTSTCLATNATPESLLFSTTLPNKTTDLAHVITTSIDSSKLDKAASHRSQTQARQLELANKSKTDSNFNTGDIVLRKIVQHTADGSRHALDTKFCGPFRIQSTGNSHAIITPVGDNYSGTTKVHYDHLKPYMTSSEPHMHPSWDKNIRHALNLNKRKSPRFSLMHKIASQNKNPGANHHHLTTNLD